MGTSRQVWLEFPLGEAPFADTVAVANQRAEEIVRGKIERLTTVLARYPRANHGDRVKDGKIVLEKVIELTESEKEEIRELIEKKETEILVTDILRVEDVENVFVGFGDVVSFGISRWLRDLLEIEGGVDENSKYYQSGSVYGGIINDITLFLLGARGFVTFQDFVGDPWIRNFLKHHPHIKRGKAYFRIGRGEYKDPNGFFPARHNVPRISIGPDNKHISDNEIIQSIWNKFRANFAHIDLRFRPLDNLKSELRHLNNKQIEKYLEYLEKRGDILLAEKVRRISGQ